MFYKQNENGVITNVLYLNWENANEDIKADYQYTDKPITTDENNNFVIGEW